MKLPHNFSRRARQSCLIVHLWTGLILGIWFVMMGLTGSVLAWRSEFTGWQARARVGAPKPARGEKIIPVSRAIAAFKAADPTLQPERGFFIPPGEYGYYLLNVYGGAGDKRTTMIYLVNPVTAQVYGPIDRDTLWVKTFEELHANLLWPVKGNISNGVLSFAALFLLASGAWLWWPSNWAQLKQRLWIKRGASLRRTLYDAHNLMGVYLYGLIFTLCLTGALLVWNGQTDESLTRFVDRSLGTSPAAETGSETVSGGQMPDVKARGEMLGADELVARAKSAVPNGTLLFISLPGRAGQPFQTAFDPIGFNNGLVLFDPYTGARLSENGDTFTPGAKTMKVVGDLHYGWFGGVWSKVFYTLAGLMPLGLMVTGTWMWARKKFKKRARRAGEVRVGETVEV